MSNPFDGDEANDEKSGSIKRLLRMRKWVAAVCVPLLLFHFGYLNVDALVEVIPAVDIPEHIVVNFLFGSALFQAVMFTLAMMQFVVIYEYWLSDRTHHNIQAAQAALAGNVQRLEGEIATFKNRGHRDDEPGVLKVRKDIEQLHLDHVVFMLKARQIRYPEIAQDVLRLAPTILLWMLAVGIHVASLAGWWTGPI